LGLTAKNAKKAQSSQSPLLESNRKERKENAKIAKPITKNLRALCGKKSHQHYLSCEDIIFFITNLLFFKGSGLKFS
jgi:hypothetical protein